MAEDFSRYDKPRKLNYFPPLPPLNRNQSDADHRAVKTLTVVQHKLGPGFGHAEAARYYRDSAAKDAENADFYEELARVEDELAKQKADTTLAAEKLEARQQAFAAMREKAEQDLENWCREHGLAPEFPSEDRQVQDRQPHHGQSPNPTQGAHGANGQDAQPARVQDAQGQDSQSNLSPPELSPSPKPSPSPPSKANSEPRPALSSDTPPIENGRYHYQI